MLRRTTLVVWFAFLGLMLGGGDASAHYFYTQFPTSSGPFTPIVQKFDVSSLPNGTIRYFIAATGPSKLAAGDSFRGLISEIRAAAREWNTIGTATIRLEYGGLYQPGIQPAAAGIFIDFSDKIPAGLLAISQPTDLGPLQTAQDGSQFYPIVHARMLLPTDMSQLPSFSEGVYTTLVHEFGHTLGLQHTITSSAMSTNVTSGVSRATPLAADDIAGLSWLYPTADFLANTGTVSGTVVDSNGNGVNLASVAVIAPGLEPVSAFTNPDGTYTIHGIAPGAYLLYVQPLPPPFLGQTTNDGIVYPVGPDGQTPFAPSNFFAGQFYPGTQYWTQAASVNVVSAANVPGLNFQVQPVSAPAVYGVRTYGYVPNGVAVAAPPIVEGTTLTVEASGAGLVIGNNLVPGLNLGVLSGLAEVVPGSIGVYPPPNPYNYIFASVQINVQALNGSGHLLFQTPGDVYVLPQGFQTVSGPPPSITSLTPFTSRIVAIQGQNLSKDTRILFDGAPAHNRAFTADGILIVSVPPAPGGYAANVVALNPDGQSSLFLGPPVPFTYNKTKTPVIYVTPAVLPAGATTVVDVLGRNTDFVDGEVRVGFGTSDIVVNSVQVDGPNHLLVTVTTPPNVSVQTTSAISVANGLEALSVSLGSLVGQQ